MPGFVHFLRCVGKAAVKNGARGLASLVPFGEVAFEVARDAFEEYRKGSGEADLRAALEGLAQTPPAEVCQAAEEIARQEAAGQPAEIQLALVSYLSQMPAGIRQSLRRPSDPGGITAPPGLSLRGPGDLLPFLPAGRPRFKPGDRPLAADWELVELLGKGGFGEVWKARHLHRSSRKPVALKFCLDPVAAHSLRNEAALHDHLDRVREESSAPGIVPLLETYLRADPPCLMYEYVEGGDLAGLLREMHQQGQLTPAVAARVVRRLASILAGAHRLNPPLVHRDLKPANVLVRRDGGDELSLLVTDFGIGGLAAGQVLREQARGPGASNRTLPAAVRGAYTPLYASPQQIEGRPPDPRDDVHALGVIWYQLLTGDLNLLAIPPDWRDVAEERGLGEEPLQVLACCLASRADRRPASAAELADRLAALPDSRPAGAKTVGAGVRPRTTGAKGLSGQVSEPVQPFHGPQDDPPAIVTGPRRAYTLVRLLAAGDVADVHLAGARTDPGAATSRYILKLSRGPEGRALLDNERAALAHLLTRAGDTTYHKYLPTLAESFAAEPESRRRVNVFLYDPGFYTLEQVHERHPALDGRHLAWIFKRLLTVLGFVHGQGRIHGAVLPCHVLLHPANHGLRLVGWGQSVETGGQVRVVAPRYGDWYPPEVLKRQPASPATDLFLAARCLVYLAGGDPVSDRMPDAVPVPMRRFLETCLLEGVKMRPRDAWELLDEFDELLRQLYGPPKFHDLTMT